MQLIVLQRQKGGKTMLKKCKDFQDLLRCINEQKRTTNENLKKQSMKASWRTLKDILTETDYMISLIEENAHEYFFANSVSEYRMEITACFGEEPMVDGEHVKMSRIYRLFNDAEMNTYGIIILVEDI